MECFLKYVASDYDVGNHVEYELYQYGDLYKMKEKLKYCQEYGSYDYAI